MKIKELLSHLASSIDLSKTLINSFPSLIFLCGGPLDPVNSSRIYSGRDFFYKYLKKKDSKLIEHIKLAEEITQAFNVTREAYNDLLSFEKDLAGLSSLTLVFVEGSGAIAELGSFTVLEEINTKLILIIQQRFKHDASFIMHGPVGYLKQLESSYPPLYYQWESSDANDTKNCNNVHAKDLEDSVLEILNGLPSRASFKINKPGHVMLLIAEILKIVRIATIKEIEHLLFELKLSESCIKSVKKYTSLLIALGYVYEEDIGRTTYYLYKKDERLRLDFAFTQTPMSNDIIRWKSIFSDFYRTSDKRKSDIISMYMN